MVELVDTRDLKSLALTGVRVQVPPSAHMEIGLNPEGIEAISVLSRRGLKDGGCEA